MTGEWEEDDRADDAEALFRGAVSQRKGMLRIERQAKAELAAEGTPPVPPVWPGDEFLAQPDEQVPWRIDGLWPAGGNVLLAAQYKAGKTTAVHNLVRSLCDGGEFLGRFRVIPPEGAVFVIDAEMPPDGARRWLRDQGICKPARFAYVNIRAAASSFNMLIPEIRKAWARRIAAAGASIVILDCIGPVLGALGLDEGKQLDVAQFLALFDEMTQEAGAQESAVIHHMGHTAERSRGASRFLDWPDAGWQLVRQTEDPASPRFFKAFGRGVDVAECRLEYDPATRALSIQGGSRTDAKTGAALSDLIKVITAQPGIGTRAIEDTLTGGKYAHARDAARAAVSRALAEGLILCRPGPNRSKQHYPANPAAQTLMGQDPPEGASLTGLPPGAAHAGRCPQNPHAQPEEAA